MQKRFFEIVIEGPFVLVKGFLMGFLYGGDKTYDYFFHRKSGIRRETLKEFLKEIFEFENYVHLCIEEKVHDKFIAAIEKSYPKIGLKVRSSHEIKSARFSLRYEIFNENLSKEAISLIEDLPADVELIDYKPVITVRNDAVGVEGYAPEHSYIATGSGKVQGDFNGIINYFLKI